MSFPVMQYSELKWRDVENGKVDIAAMYSGYLYSEKMDGWFAYWDGRDLHTKSGKRAFALPKELKATLPPTPLVGELVVLGRQATAVASLMRSDGPWSQARLYAFDLPQSPLPFGARTRALEALVKRRCKGRGRGCFLQYLAQTPITTNEKFKADFQAIINCTDSRPRAGRSTECFGEGVVITDPESLYSDGRADKKTRVKLKKIQDAEGKVVGYNRDPTSLRVHFRNRNFNLGIGLAGSERRDLEKNFPLHSWVKFSYRALGGNGRPKEARLIGRRDEVDTKTSGRRPRSSGPRRVLFCTSDNEDISIPIYDKHRNRKVFLEVQHRQVKNQNRVSLFAIGYSNRRKFVQKINRQEARRIFNMTDDSRPRMARQTR